MKVTAGPEYVEDTAQGREERSERTLGSGSAGRAVKGAWAPRGRRRGAQEEPGHGRSWEDEGRRAARTAPRQGQLTPCRQPRQSSAAFCDACGRTRSPRRHRHLPQTSNASGIRPLRAAELPPWQQQRRGDGSTLRTKFLNAKRRARTLGGGARTGSEGGCLEPTGSLM